MRVKSFFGSTLMFLGGLVAFLSGLCSLGFIAISIANDPAGTRSALTAVVFIGGIPFAAGLFLFAIGMVLKKLGSD